MTLLIENSSTPNRSCVVEAAIGQPGSGRKANPRELDIVVEGCVGSVEKNVLEKSSVEEIRNRFDRDVERFSNLETARPQPSMPPSRSTREPHHGVA